MKKALLLLAACSSLACGGGGAAFQGSTTGQFDSVSFACWGDSLTAPDIGYADAFALAYTPNRIVFNGGVRGQTMAQITARMLSAPADVYRNRVLIVHDKVNLTEDVTHYVEDVDRMIAHQTSGKYVIVSGIYSVDGTEAPGSEYYNRQHLVNLQMQAKYGVHFLDVSVLLADPATRQDAEHITPVARDRILIPAIKAKLVALGYLDVTQ